MRSTKVTMVLRCAMAIPLGAFALAIPTIGADTPGQTAANAPTAVAAQPLAFPAGFEQKNVKAESGVKSGLAKLTERALTKGDFNKFLAELSTQDKERAREFKGVDQAKLDAAIEQIQKDWQGKYGKNFEMSDKVFDTGVAIVQGEVSDPAVALNNWPVPSVTGEAAPAAAQINPGDVKKAAKDEKLTKGRNVAIVRFLEKDKSEMTVSMLHELPAFYRVDIPNDITGEQIYNNLLAHLTALHENSSKWPADVNEGYRHVARCVAESVYGIPVPAAKG